jgi:hypothetical protein
MITAPQLQYCDARPYAAIRARLRNPAQVSAWAPLMWAEVRSWLAFEGRLEAGAPFVRYFTLADAGPVEVEAGLTTFSPLNGANPVGAGRIVTGVLSAGEYATLLHDGPAEELAGARTALRSWGREQGLRFETDVGSPNGELFEFHLRNQEIEIALRVPSIPEGL